MALEIQKARLRGFIEQMYAEGIVNDQFCHLQAVKASTKPDYALREATLYCLAAQSLFIRISLQMDQPVVDYCRVTLFAQELCARSISIGAEQVTRACISIIQACEERNKQECNQALYLTKNEFCNLRRRFEILVQVKNLINAPTYADYTWHSSSYSVCCTIKYLTHYSLPISGLKLAVRKDSVSTGFCYSIVRMAISILNELLRGYVQSLIDEGIVNNHFTQVQALKSTEERGAFVQMIDIYCVDVDAIFLELRNCIDHPEVDFLRLAASALKIEETSSSVGAEQVRIACKGLIQACDEKNKENISRALTWLKNEFAKTKNKLETFAQMERRIIRLEQKESVCSMRLSDSPGVRRKFLPK